MVVIPMILPLLAWGVVAVLGGGLIGGAIGSLFDDPQKNKLGILGMQKAGKTRFLSFLRNIPFEEKASGRDSYVEFRYKLQNKKEITISAGRDIGGGNAYRVDYNKILQSSNVILYFFDINRYLKNELDQDGILYQRSCNSRFEHIYSELKKSNKPIIIVATHKDHVLLSENEIKLKFDTLVQNANKSYKEMLKNIHYVNLTSDAEMKNLIEKIFNS
ncbi:GTPase domain-containing protein [Myroides sp. DW712]|uniref:GTPase domain-containing protein n=1 Tax=Myroides sp. DW712 TaxID=3389800 RepID=UPI00397BE676